MKIKNKSILTVFSIFLFLIILLASCKGPDDNSHGVEIARTGRVTFVNQSGYMVNIRLGNFSGIMLLEHLNSGSNMSANVRVSDPHGLGTTFAYEYLFRINDILQLFDPVYGDIFAIAQHLELQPNLIIEEGKSYTVQIPHPVNPSARNAHIAIINLHNQPVDFRNLGGALRQTNTNIPIQPYMTGVYRIENIPQSGMSLQGHFIRQVSVTTPFPDTELMNGVLYRYSFDGTSVRETHPPFNIWF